MFKVNLRQLKWCYNIKHIYEGCIFLIKMHDSVAATYLKYFSDDPSKGRKSIVKVYNKKLKIKQDLAVKNFPLNRKAFSTEVEAFFSSIEKNYDSFTDLILDRYPSSVTEEKIKIGTAVFFNFILRKPLIFKKLKEFHSNNPESINKYGSDPWHSLELISSIFIELLTKRPYPIRIFFYPEAFFITSDDPIVYERHPFGTIYMLPIDRKHLFCLGYYIGEHLLSQLEQYLDQHDFRPKNINIKIRKQARTFYVI